MLKDPSASWMRAGVFYWLGYAGPYLLAGLARLVVVDTAGDRLDAVSATSNAWALGLVGALCFALGLLVLSMARPCRPENVKGSAALGALTAVIMIAIGVEWTTGSAEADYMLICAAMSALVLHFFTPRIARPLPRSRRAKPAPPPLSIIQASQVFGFNFALLSIFWYIAFNSIDDSNVVFIRLLALPGLFIVSAMYGFITAIAFGLGAALAYYARGVRTLPAWYCVASAGFTIVLLLAESSLAGSFGYYLSEGSWLMVSPLLPGLGAVLLPGPRKTA